MVTDASLLADYVATDPTPLGLAARHLGGLHVPSRVQEEVPELGAEACGALGIVLVEETLDQLVRAGARRDRLSFSDRMCLVLARESGWACLTNERALASACAADGVPALGGLELLARLVAAGHLAAPAARAAAEALHRVNPRHHPRAAIVEFCARVDR
jgi:hypothetical protein